MCRSHAYGAGMLLCLMAGVATAQTSNVRVARFTTADGLPSNKVHGVVQDSVGFIWIGTPLGLYRFDGHTYERFQLSVGQPSRADSTLLLGEPGQLKPLAVDAEGRLWVAVFDRLFRTNLHTGTVTEISDTTGHHRVTLGPDGAIWYSTGKHLFRAARDGETAHRRPALSVSGRIDALTAGSHRLWMAVHRPNGVLLISYDPESAIQQRYETPWRRRVRELLVDSAGRVWMGGEPGLSVLDPVASRLTPVTGLGNETVTGLVQDHEERLWIATGRFVGHLDSGRVRHVLPADGVVAPFGPGLMDRDGTLWFTSLASGLHRIDPRPPPIHHFALGELSPETRNGSFVLSLLEAADGSVFVGRLGGGILRLRVTASGVAPLPDRSFGVLEGVNVWSLMTDSHGRLWIGGDGVLCAQVAPGTALDCASPPVGSGAVTAMLERDNGTLWIGLYPGGVAVFRPGGGDAPASAGRFDRGRNRSRVIALKRDRHGTVWALGVAPHDLLRYDVTEGDFVPASMVPWTLPDGLHAYAMHHGADGRFWIGSDQGLHRWNPAAAGDDGRSSVRTLYARAAVFSILPDGRGSLWLGTSHGLLRYGVDETIQRFGPRWGTGNVEYNRNAALRLTDGTLLFGGADGLTRVYPGRLRKLRRAPPVVFTRMETVSHHGTTTTTLYEADTIRVRPQDFTFSVEFAALDYEGGTFQRLRYRLEGVDADWIPARGTRRATYTRLPPGRHVLRLQALPPDVSDDEPTAPTVSETSLAVIVEPPFWRRASFQVFVLAVLGAALFMIHRMRVERALRVERLRLRIARDLHDDVGAGLSGIALLSDAIGRRPGLTGTERTQLAKIGRSARRLVDHLREIVWTIDPAEDRVANVLNRMQDVAGDLLPGIRWSFDAPVQEWPETLGLEQRRDLLLLYQEILHNIARHAGATQVTIRLRHRGGLLMLEVQDDGRGFDPEEATSGTGLRSIRERAARLGGAVDVRSTPGEGTTVRVTLPLT